MKYILALIPLILPFISLDANAKVALRVDPRDNPRPQPVLPSPPRGDRFATATRARSHPVVEGPITTPPDRVLSAPKPTHKIRQTTRAEIIRRQKRKLHRPVRRLIPSPTPPPPHITARNSEVFDLMHVAPHFLTSLGDDNPVNDDVNWPPVQTTYPRTMPQNQVLVECASFALSQPMPYWSLTLWYSDSRDMWICQTFVRYLYEDRNTEADWKVENLDANPVFGYEYFSLNPM
ncbi:hypothetical protein CI109_100031 [Kwoniella shandongensis]|uniref:Uncharacterized protein n=1 Tax=Kwoniella shandongensis TaxID=1734106 RepID=A0A5M6BS06_9TREE|nr:uncharacterized protein CI109_005996 [Kwoniella shandongensis]KAA5525688.1 hypothetical protein CI109_005996 [Kwoniella shandongensis]